MCVPYSNFSYPIDSFWGTHHAHEFLEASDRRKSHFDSITTSSKHNPHFGMDQLLSQERFGLWIECSKNRKLVTEGCIL